MAKYHVNPATGKAGLCRAKKACRFGSFEDHYDSPEDAAQAYEEKMASEVLVAHRSSPSNPMSVLPLAHRDLPETSDAFYNTTGVADPATIDALASYHYYKYLYRKRDKNEYKLSMLQAKQVLLATEGGKNYKGWRNENGAILTTLPDATRGKLEGTARARAEEELPPLGTVRSHELDDEAVKEYALSSAEWLKELTPEEHTTVAYWTSCGSSIGATAALGVKNTWDLQTTDKRDKRTYFDGERLMATMDSALAKVPEGPPMVLYRGLNYDVASASLGNQVYDEEAVEKWLQEDYPVGKEIEFKLPQSTAHDPSDARRFATSNILYEIKATKAAPVGVTSAWSIHETEYIIPRTTKYRVVAIDRKAQIAKEDYSADNGRTYTMIQLEQVSS